MIPAANTAYLWEDRTTIFPGAARPGYRCQADGFGWMPPVVAVELPRLANS